MKRHKCIIFFNLFLILSLQATQLTLELIDNGQGQTGGQTVFAGVPFTFRAVVAGEGQNTDAVEIKGLNQLQVTETGQSTNISVINGKMSSEVSHTYRAYTTKEGDLTLGPATLKLKDQTVESNVLTLHVAKAPENPQPAAQQTTAETEAADDNSQAPQAANILCKLSLNKKTAVVGEQIIAKVTIYSHGQILQSVIEPPKFNNFSVKEIKQITRKQETVNNNTFNVFEKTFILTPQQAGPKEIAPIRVIYTTPVATKKRHRRWPFDDDFFGAFERASIEQREVFSNAATVTVTPLPDGPAADGIGSFSLLRAKLDKKEAVINEAVTLTLDIQGEGNFEHISAPKLILPNFIKHYESKSTISEDLSTDYKGGKKSFEYIIQVGQEGSVEIPAQTFAFFDPMSKKYKTLTTAPLTITINPAPTPDAVVAPPTQTETPVNNEKPKKEIKLQEKQDIHFIQEEGPISRKKADPVSFILFIIFLLLVPLFFYGQPIRDFLSKKLGFYGGLTKKAQQKNMLKMHKEFNTLAKTNQPGKLYQFFLKFLATKFNVTPEEVTHDWLQEHLVQQQWPPEKIGTFLEYLNECAGIHFTIQDKGATAKDHALLFEKGSYWILLLTN